MENNAERDEKENIEGRVDEEANYEELDRTQPGEADALNPVKIEEAMQFREGFDCINLMEKVSYY